MNLYELTLEFRSAAERLSDMDLDEQTLADTLESMSGELEAKCQNTIMVARNLEATAHAIKQAEMKMAERRKALENRAAWLRDNVHASMLSTGIQKIETPWFKLSIRQNPPAVEVFDASMVPAEFTKIPDPPPPAPDKTAIKAAIKAGIEVPGCRLTQGTRLDVS